MTSRWHLTVLYLSANGPSRASMTTAPRLRLDREVRDVRVALARSVHRHRIDLTCSWAATAPDIVDALNTVRPHVVQFSGHATGTGLDLDPGPGDDGTATAPTIDYRVLARILDASASPPGLVVLNACHTSHAAEQLLAAVPAVVGMRDAIRDDAATVFAAAFYGAVGAGQPLHHCVEQGRLAMTLQGHDYDATLPTIATRSNVDARRFRPLDHTVSTSEEPS